MAYYRALQQIALPEKHEDKPAWARRWSLWAIFWICFPFTLALAAVGALHFNDHCLTANTFAELFDFRWRTDAAAAVILLVLLSAPFPSLFAVLAWQSRGNVIQGGAGETFKSFADEIRYRRSLRFLGEEARPVFFRRFAFALAMVLVCDGLVAQLFHYPTGVFAGGQILQLAVMGAGGFYLYALIAFTQRFWTGSLSYRMLASFYTRLAVVLILSGVLTILNGTAALVFTAPAAFLAGIFPDTALLAISKNLPTGLGSFAVDPRADFGRLPELTTLWRQAELVELGINDVHDLANSGLEDVLLDVGIIPPVVLQAVDRALLLDAFSAPGRAPTAPAGASPPDPIEGLKRLGVTSASELVLYLLGQNVKPPDDPPPGQRRRLAAELDAQTAKARRDQVMSVLGRGPVTAVAEGGGAAATVAPASPAPAEPLELGELHTNANVLYILRKRFQYADV